MYCMEMCAKYFDDIVPLLLAGANIPVVPLLKKLFRANTITAVVSEMSRRVILSFKMFIVLVNFHIGF